MTDSLRALAERAAREASREAADDMAKRWNYSVGDPVIRSELFTKIADAIERVARQAVEDEREACAKLVADSGMHDDAWDIESMNSLADAIRARGGKS